MPKQHKDGPDEILADFGVRRRSLEADVKRRIASLDAGHGVQSEQAREMLRLHEEERRKTKDKRSISR